MLDAASIEALTRSMMLGTSRHAASVPQAFGKLLEPGEPAATLKALALLGQHIRFRRPIRRIAGLSPESLFPDERTIIPEGARALLMRLLSGQGAKVVDAVPLAVADAMARQHLKLHPFDLPRLEDFVKAHGEQLGTSAIAWTERNAATTTIDAYAFVDTIDETNWTRGRPAQKAAFIRGLRATDAARARSLVEGVFASEPAPVRLALIKAMSERLSTADASFLEGLSKDRAPSVREAAEALLARLPGSAQAAKRLQDCLSRIKKTKAGRLRRRVVLQLDYPATVHEVQRPNWAVATFGTIALDDFAATLELSVDEIVAASADDQVLMLVLAVQASLARRYDLLSRLIRGGAANAWTALVQANDIDVPPESAPAWSEAAIQPDLWTELPVEGLMDLYAKLRQPLPRQVAESVLASKVWRDTLGKPWEKLPPPGLFSSVAVLAPASVRAALRADLARIAPDYAARALTALSLLDLIETT